MAGTTPNDAPRRWDPLAARSDPRKHGYRPQSAGPQDERMRSWMLRSITAAALIATSLGVGQLPSEAAPPCDSWPFNPQRRFFICLTEVPGARVFGHAYVDIEDDPTGRIDPLYQV